MIPITNETGFRRCAVKISKFRAQPKLTNKMETNTATLIVNTLSINRCFLTTVTGKE